MQRVFKVFIVLVLLQGCSAVKREAGYPGGNAGYVADRYALFARGQTQQVNRYLVALALLAPLIVETANSSTEAKLSAERIKVLYQDIDKLEKASARCSLPTKLEKEASAKDIELKDCDDAKAAHKDGSALSFETLSYDVSKSLNDALTQTFDNLEIRTNASRLIALEPTEIFKTIVKARRLVPVFMSYLSAYRDVSIVFGVSIAESCPETSSKPLTKVDRACDKLVNKFQDLINRERHADADVASQERPISDVFYAGKKALDEGLDWKLTSVHRIALLSHVNRACKKLDALAKIDHEDYEDGCSVTLTGSSSDSKEKSKTQKAAESLIIPKASES